MPTRQEISLIYRLWDLGKSIKILLKLKHKKMNKHYIKTGSASWLRTAEVTDADLTSGHWENCLVFDIKDSAEAIATLLKSIKGHETPQQLQSLFNDIITNPDNIR